MLKQNSKNSGFTLIEAMMAMVLLSIATAGLLLPFASAVTVQQEGVDRTLAVRLACDLTEQIVNTDFDKIVAKYGNYSETAGQVKQVDGSIFSGSMYANYSRKAHCEYIYTAQQDGLDAPNFIRITVQVYYNGSKMADLVRLKSR